MGLIRILHDVMLDNTVKNYSSPEQAQENKCEYCGRLIVDINCSGCGAPTIKGTPQNKEEIVIAIKGNMNRVVIEHGACKSGVIEVVGDMSRETIRIDRDFRLIVSGNMNRVNNMTQYSILSNEVKGDMNRFK